MKIPSKIIYLIVSIIVLVFVIYAFLPDESKSGSDVNSSSVDYNKLDEIIFKVKTKEVIKSDLIKKITANGIVRSDKELDISANINGVISKINIFEGKYVKKNELLIQLDDRDSKIDLRESEERIVEAKVNYGLLIKDAPTDSTKNDEILVIQEQLSDLEEQYKNSLFSESEYVKKKDELEMKLIFTGAKREELILNKSGYNAAINQIERAKLNLAHTNIMAPFNGVIGNFDLVVGQRISTGKELFKLFSTQIMKVNINILESELNNIQIGNSVEIEISAFSDEKFIGYVSQISPYIDRENRTCRVIISIKNINSKIKSGMFASVKIACRTFKNKLIIPKDALLVRDKRNLVFTVEESLAKWKYIDIGERNDQFIEVVQGIELGDKIIVEGHFNLAHDSKVRVVN